MIWFWLVAALIVFIGLGVFFGAPYVPSRRRELDAVFTQGYPLKPTDVLVDIGSGDGVVLRAALRAGAKRAIGFEIHPLFVFISRLLRSGEVRHANGWRAEYPDGTTVVYVFAVERDVRRMHESVARQARRLGRPLTLISYGAQIPGVEPAKLFRAYSIYTVSPDALQSEEA